MGSITNIRRYCAIACCVRGRRVEIIYPDDLRVSPFIVDAVTRKRVRWRLTPAEHRDIDGAVTERYQPRGIE